MGTTPSIESAFAVLPSAKVAIHRVGDSHCALGCSPWWSSQSGALFWVDGLGSKIHRQDGTKHSEWHLPGRFLGSLVGVARPRGARSVFTRSHCHLVLCTLWPQLLASGAVRCPLVPLEPRTEAWTVALALARGAVAEPLSRGSRARAGPCCCWPSTSVLW